LVLKPSTVEVTNTTLERIRTLHYQSKILMEKRNERGEKERSGFTTITKSSIKNYKALRIIVF